MKKIVAFMILLIIFNSIYFSTYAHYAELHVSYDNCISLGYGEDGGIGDGYDEKWYELIDRTNQSIHIKHDNSSITTIRYYFDKTKENLEGDSITWHSNLSDEQSTELINGISHSLEKWNNVYFYINNGDYYSKKRIVNVIPGTEDNHNLVIVPNYSSILARTKGDARYLDLNESFMDNGIRHIHRVRWQLEFSITKYLEYINIAPIYQEKIFERVGAHELGHILGLNDIDYIEMSNSNSYHHEELLMGYSQFISNSYDETTFLDRQTEITYRDIAGTAITRGYHNDNNHKWLCDENSIDGKYKLICSICNGVKYVESLENITYNMYKFCNNAHNLEDGNMMPVACYGTKDYYKCKYCRYVAPFTSIVEQNYVTDASYNSMYHYILNDVKGLEYKILDEHKFDYNVDNAFCIHCNHKISMNEIIVTDPDRITNCGSQINVYEKNILVDDRSYRENTIIQGFTRLLYFATPIAPSISRLDYNWTSSNPNIATVSNYGTVTAMKVTEPTSVIISAKHKTSDVILYKKLWILPDTSDKLMIINYEIQMDKDETYGFALDEKAPTVSLQNYTWYVSNQTNDSAGVSISQWGTITALAPGIMYIEGAYKLNSNVIILIKVTVN